MDMLLHWVMLSGQWVNSHTTTISKAISCRPLLTPDLYQQRSRSFEVAKTLSHENFPSPHLGAVLWADVLLT